MSLITLLSFTMQQLFEGTYSQYARSETWMLLHVYLKCLSREKTTRKLLV